MDEKKTQGAFVFMNLRKGGKKTDPPPPPPCPQHAYKNNTHKQTHIQQQTNKQTSNHTPEKEYIYEFIS